MLNFKNKVDKRKEKSDKKTDRLRKWTNVRVERNVNSEYRKKLI